MPRAQTVTWGKILDFVSTTLHTREITVALFEYKTAVATEGSVHCRDVRIKNDSEYKKMSYGDHFKVFQEKIEACLWDIQELESLRQLAEGNPAFSHIQSDLESAKSRLDKLLEEVRFMLH